MTIATILPTGRTCFYDANGVPLVNGYIYFYIPNTNTPKNTWQDAGQNTLNVNPVRLDSLGSALIYGYGQYRMLVKDSSLNTIYDALTQDIMGLFTPQTSTTDGSAYIGYLYPSGVARSLYSKITDYWRSVKDFGATGDGSTDDTTAIQNALTSLNSSGGVLYFPTGLYRITSALSVTFTGTTDLQLNRPSIRGDGSGQSRILWDGANSPSTYMLTIKRTDASDNVGLHAHSIIEGIGLAPINSGKNYYASGLYLSKWAYLDVRDIYTHRLEVSMYLDQVISSSFLKLVIANNDYGLQSIGAPSSITTGDIYANNANTFIDCTIGGNNIGGFSSVDGSFVMLGGSIESNGAGGTAGTGYGAYISNTAVGMGVACNFNGVYIEGNGSTGNAGANAATADIWINHNNTADGQIYVIENCSFTRLTSAYAPYSIYVNAVATTDCVVRILGDNFSDDGAYTPSSSRPVVKFNNGGGTLTHIKLDNKANNYKNAAEDPDFALGTAYYKGMDEQPGAVVYPSVQQSIADNTTTALNFSTALYNNYSIFDVSSPTKLTVPTNVSAVRIQGNIRFASSNVDGSNMIILLRKNGSATFNGNPRASLETGPNNLPYEMNVSSPILLVTAGDYFELCVLQATGGALNTDATFTSQWFSMEIIR